MQYEMIFSVSSSIVMLCWLALIAMPKFYQYVIPATQIAIPGLLALTYVFLVVTGFGSSEGGYESFAAVKQLFRSDTALLAGWIHFLAFDLLVGVWEVKESRRTGIPHWLLIPCLLLTFAIGPAGWLLFILIRFFFIRRLKV